VPKDRVKGKDKVTDKKKKGSGNFFLDPFLLFLLLFSVFSEP